MFLPLPKTFGHITKHALVVGSENRSYFFHLPVGYSPEKTYPLVLMYHGYADTPAWASFYSGWNKKADEEQFIVIYPQGTKRIGDVHLSWNAVFCCDLAAQAYADDIGFTEKLIEYVGKAYHVDDTKIYATGFSNGAMMVHRLGVSKASLFAAIAPVAGVVGMQRKCCQQFGLLEVGSQPLPVMLVHGEKDSVLPYQGGHNRRGQFASFRKGIEIWQATNKTETNGTRHELFGGSVVKEYYKGQADVQALTFKEGRHIWFGGPYEKLKHPLSYNPNLTDLLWAFFKDHSNV